MHGINFPQGCQIVEAIPAQVGAGAAVTGDYISVKNIQRVWCVIQYSQADANAITWKVERATAVAGTGHAALGTSVPIWSNLDTATSDLLVKRTAAVTYATDAGATNKIVVFEIDPASLGSTYDVIAVSSTTVIAAGQYVSGFYIIEPRYQSAVINIPSYIID
jgi:hypothetical protein